MEKAKWFDRKFSFDSTQNIFPSIIERLRGTPARLEERIRSISPAIFTTRYNNNWSIAENIGHLTDLEPLWQGRLEDIIQKKEMMRPTDLENKKTHEANHNNVAMD